MSKCKTSFEVGGMGHSVKRKEDARLEPKKPQPPDISTFIIKYFSKTLNLLYLQPS